MDVIEHEFLPPFSYSNDFYHSLKNKFEKFNSYLIDSTDLEKDDNSELNELKSCQGKILKVISLYFEGNLLKAFECFQDLMDVHFFNIVGEDKTIEKGSVFFRIRKMDSSFLDDKMELFHIPFQKRSKVSNQRFSLVGFPCLYLGDSLYVCWEELNRPKSNEFLASKLEYNKPRKKLRLIDIRLDQMYDFDCFIKENNDINIINCLHWSLVAACSYIVKDKNDPFKPEYIIPQILLQWVINMNNERDENRPIIDGIVYTSSKVKINGHRNVGAVNNYVIPVKSIKTRGYCQELQKMFDIYNPRSPLLEEQIVKKLPSVSKELRDVKFRFKRLRFNPYENISYINTKLGRLELALMLGKHSNS